MTTIDVDEIRKVRLEEGEILVISGCDVGPELYDELDKKFKEWGVERVVVFSEPVTLDVVAPHGD